jgi:hypothetical protein
MTAMYPASRPGLAAAGQRPIAGSPRSATGRKEPPDFGRLLVSGLSSLLADGYGCAPAACGEGGKAGESDERHGPG